jgi:hypothetical protein
MSALLTPVPRQQAYKQGLACPGALLFTWAAGQAGVLKRPTFTDAALTVPNANPIIADATGVFGPIYLSACLVYDFEYCDANGVVQWAQPNVMTGAIVSSAPAADLLSIEQALHG